MVQLINCSFGVQHQSLMSHSPLTSHKSSLNLVSYVQVTFRLISEKAEENNEIYIIKTSPLGVQESKCHTEINSEKHVDLFLLKRLNTLTEMTTILLNMLDIYILQLENKLFFYRPLLMIGQSLTRMIEILLFQSLYSSLSRDLDVKER